jgi:hypothetical protein
MSNTIAGSAAGSTSANVIRRVLTRITVAAAGAAVLFTASAPAVHAQDAPAHRPGWEFLVHSGTVIPTGAQRESVKRGKLTAAQLTYVAHPAVAVTATVGWARSRDIASAGDPKLDVFTYDVGAEFRAPRHSLGGRFSIRPFAGIGAGARSYDYRSLDMDATHNAAAYGSAGAELGSRRVRLRVEAREYVTGFKPLSGAGRADTRNDVAIMAGLRFAAR